jgi:hypothetical protein
MAWTLWRSVWVRDSVVIAMLIGACTPGGDEVETAADSDPTSPGDACEMCGETPCHPGGADCFDAAFCVPPADDACVACMMANCPDSVGASCSGFDFDCVDYAKTIGGCGDAVPYAEQHYECMAMSCAAECSPGEGFTACACI